MRRLGPFLLAALCLLFSGRAWAFTTVRLALQWVPQAQFAGYYVAFEKGFYLRRGLDVFIVRGGPDRDPLEALQENRADVGTFFLTAALLYRDREIPLVHLGQIVRRSHQTILARRDRDITSLEDLDGRTMSLWGDAFKGAFLALLEDRDVRPRLVPQHYSVNLFRRGHVDACSAMSYNEVHLLHLSGMKEEELVLFDLAREGYDFPEDGLYALPDFVEANPRACRDLVEATLEGWRYAAAHPEEALDIVMTYARLSHTPTNRPHQRWMLETLLPSILEEPMGHLDEALYEKAASTLKRVGLIGEAPSYGVFRGLRR